MTRRWHSGNENVAPGHEPLQPEDLLFLDIIITGETNDHKPQYWYCNASYTQSASDTWATVSNYWTEAEEQFDFIATNLLLAPNAKINFLTNNEIYLMNSAGTIVTGGARGASSDDDIIFWAGSDNPSDAPFQVDYQGNLIATSGVFSGYIRMPYVMVSDLDGDGNGTYSADTRAYLVSQYDTERKSITNLILPRPSEELNGFTYEIIVVPTWTFGISGGSRAGRGRVPSGGINRSNMLAVSVMGGDSLTSYAFVEQVSSTTVTFTGGRYTVTCMPTGDYIQAHQSHGQTIPAQMIYRWAITMATGELIFDTDEVSGNGDPIYRTVSPMIGANIDTLWGNIFKIMTYTGTTVPYNTTDSAFNTLFVSRDYLGV